MNSNFSPIFSPDLTLETGIICTFRYPMKNLFFLASLLCLHFRASTQLYFNPTFQHVSPERIGVDRAYGQCFANEEQYAQLDEVFTEWKGDFEQLDDVCVFGVKIDLL